MVTLVCAPVCFVGWGLTLGYSELLGLGKQIVNRAAVNLLPLSTFTSGEASI